MKSRPNSHSKNNQKAKIELLDNEIVSETDESDEEEVVATPVKQAAPQPKRKVRIAESSSKSDSEEEDDEESSLENSSSDEDDESDEEQAVQAPAKKSAPQPKRRGVEASKSEEEDEEDEEEDEEDEEEDEEEEESEEEITPKAPIIRRPAPATKPAPSSTSKTISAMKPAPIPVDPNSLWVKQGWGDLQKDGKDFITNPKLMDKIFVKYSGVNTPAQLRYLKQVIDRIANKTERANTLLSIQQAFIEKLNALQDDNEQRNYFMAAYQVQLFSNFRTHSKLKNFLNDLYHATHNKSKWEDPIESQPKKVLKHNFNLGALGCFKLPPAPAPKVTPAHFKDNLFGGIDFVDPVFCKLDGVTYERKPIDEYLKKYGKSPYNGTVTGGIFVKDLLISNVSFANLVKQSKKDKPNYDDECPISKMPIVNPVICLLNGVTYEDKNIRDYLEKNKKTPAGKDGSTVALDTMTTDQVLVKNAAYESAITTIRILKEAQKFLDTNKPLVTPGSSRQNK